MYADPKEWGKQIEHDMFHEINDLESLSLKQLQDIADDQHLVLGTRMPKWKHVVETVDHIVRTAI